MNGIRMVVISAAYHRVWHVSAGLRLCELLNETHEEVHISSIAVAIDSPVVQPLLGPTYVRADSIDQQIPHHLSAEGVFSNKIDQVNQRVAEGFPPLVNQHLPDSVQARVHGLLVLALTVGISRTHLEDVLQSFQVFVTRVLAIMWAPHRTSVEPAGPQHERTVVLKPYLEVVHGAGFGHVVPIAVSWLGPDLAGFVSSSIEDIFVHDHGIHIVQTAVDTNDVVLGASFVISYCVTWSADVMKTYLTVTCSAMLRTRGVFGCVGFLYNALRRGLTEGVVSEF